MVLYYRFDTIPSNGGSVHVFFHILDMCIVNAHILYYAFYKEFEFH